MIPISYIGDLSPYNDFIAAFSSRVTSWLNRGFIYTKESPIDLQSAHLLKHLIKHIDYIANADADKLRRINQLMQNRYPDLANNKSILSKTLYRVFVKNGYEHKEFPADKLVKATDARVCPYCNRVFVESIRGSKGIVRGQLDHFYPKEKYPFLAISRYNLVPSCAYCNGPSGKHTIDPMNHGDHIVNPYQLHEHGGLRFKILIQRPGFMNLDTMADSIDIKVDTTLNPNMAANARVFNLEALYNSHKDYAAEIYFKHFINRSEHYQQFATALGGKLSQSDKDRILWGTYIDAEHICRRPLSKFTRDIIDDLDDF